MDVYVGLLLWWRWWCPSNGSCGYMSSIKERRRESKQNQRLLECTGHISFGEKCKWKDERVEVGRGHD